MRKILFTICILALLTACSKENNDNEANAERTVLIYMSAENNLANWSGTRYADMDLKEIKAGVKSIGNNNLLIYVSKAANGELPYLLRYRNGELRDSIVLSQTEELPCNPEVFEKVARKAFTDYPANSYGLVLWGHATGWVINKDSIAYTPSPARQKAYGGSNENNSTASAGKWWLNIPTLANVLKRLPHLSFIFCDCCHMACIENAYELKDVTDYLIGSPAEIPGVGAPYTTITPTLMDKTNYWMTIIDRYYEQRAGGLDIPLAAIKTNEMVNLAGTTRAVLKSFADKFGGNYPDLSGLIHYYNHITYGNQYFDMNDFILKFATTNEYQTWKQAYDKAVVYKKMAETWMTNRVIYSSDWDRYYGDFEMTEARFGGVSMFIPQYRFQFTENATIKQMRWYYAAGYSDIGW